MQGRGLPGRRTGEPDKIPPRRGERRVARIAAGGRADIPPRDSARVFTAERSPRSLRSDLSGRPGAMFRPRRTPGARRNRAARETTNEPGNESRDLALPTTGRDHDARFGRCAAPGPTSCCPRPSWWSSLGRFVLGFPDGEPTTPEARTGAGRARRDLLRADGAEVDRGGRRGRGEDRGERKADRARRGPVEARRSPPIHRVAGTRITTDRRMHPGARRPPAPLDFDAGGCHRGRDLGRASRRRRPSPDSHV